MVKIRLFLRRRSHNVHTPYCPHTRGDPTALLTLAKSPKRSGPAVILSTGTGSYRRRPSTVGATMTAVGRLLRWRWPRRQYAVAAVAIVVPVAIVVVVVVTAVVTVTARPGAAARPRDANTFGRQRRRWWWLLRRRRRLRLRRRLW